MQIRIFSMLIFLAFVLLASGTYAYVATFEWDHSPDGSVVGYYLYLLSTQYDYQGVLIWGDAQRIADVLIPLNRVTTEIPGGLFWVAATAFDAAGDESVYSDRVTLGKLEPDVKIENLPGSSYVTITRVISGLGRTCTFKECINGECLSSNPIGSWNIIPRSRISLISTTLVYSDTVSEVFEITKPNSPHDSYFVASVCDFLGPPVGEPPGP